MQCAAADMAVQNNAEEVPHDTSVCSDSEGGENNCLPSNTVHLLS